MTLPTSHVGRPRADSMQSQVAPKRVTIASPTTHITRESPAAREKTHSVSPNIQIQSPKGFKHGYRRTDTYCGKKAMSFYHEFRLISRWTEKFSSLKFPDLPSNYKEYDCGEYLQNYERSVFLLRQSVSQISQYSMPSEESRDFFKSLIYRLQALYQPTQVIHLPEVGDGEGQKMSDLALKVQTFIEENTPLFDEGVETVAQVISQPESSDGESDGEGGPSSETLTPRLGNRGAKKQLFLPIGNSDETDETSSRRSPGTPSSARREDSQLTTEDELTTPLTPADDDDDVFGDFEV